MFASLGEIVFEVLDSPTGYETRRQSLYALQRVIQAPARLQWAADDPAEILFDIRLHMSFTNPQLQILALEAALADHIARPLVFGNGDIEGFFALAELEMGVRQMSSAGDLVAAIVRVRLIEWNYALGGAVGNAISAFGALGAVAAPAGLATAPVAASAAVGVASALAAPVAPFSPAPLSAPGVSPLLSAAGASQNGAKRLLPGDVPAAQIVRSSS
jgi:phage protein U